MSTLREKTDALRKVFLDRTERTEPELTILLNGRNILALERLETPLKDGDVVVLMPPATGG